MPIARVTIEEAQRLLTEEGYRYLDVRTETEYAAGHPAGALNVPFMISGPGGMQHNDEFMTMIEQLFDKNDKLVLGCQSGPRSLRAANALDAAGFTRVVEMRAGYGGARNAFGKVTEAGWAAAGLPIETETEGGSYAALKEKTR